MNFLADLIKAYDEVRLRRKYGITDIIRHSTTWMIRRWNSEDDWNQKLIYRPELALEMFGGFPQISPIFGNIMLNEGLNAMWEKLCSSSGTLWDNTNAQLGTGTSATGEAATDTDLLAGGVWKAMDTSYPTYGTSQQAVFKSTFGSSDANQAWNEFSARNGSSANKNLNRKTSTQGTKTAGQTWELTLTITLS